jgi:hypothetical protein
VFFVPSASGAETQSTDGKATRNEDGGIVIVIAEQEKLQKRVHELLSRRLAHALQTDPNTFRECSVAGLVSVLFLLEGDQLTLGGSGDSLNALVALVGRDLFWKIPNFEKDDVKPTVQ